MTARPRPCFSAAMARSLAAEKALAQRAGGPIDLPLLARRLVFVTGKGGAGKTTVATAIALAASMAGRATTLCEIGAWNRVAGELARADRGGRLAVATIDADVALREWIARTGGRAAAAVLNRSDVFR